VKLAAINQIKATVVMSQIQQIQHKIAEEIEVIKSIIPEGFNRNEIIRQLIEESETIAQTHYNEQQS